LAEAVASLLTFLADTSAQIRHKALSHLQQIIRSKLRYLDSCLQPAALLTSWIDRFDKIEPSILPSCFMLTRQGKEDIVEEECSVLAPLL